MLKQIVLLIFVAAMVGASPRRVPIEPIDNHALDEDAKLPTPELAAKYGYPTETHTVTTKDGYILTLHRIPNGKNAAPAPPEGRPVVFLQHGLLCSSSDWLMNTREKALAYRLSDAGYDVWMGNGRGNTYSKAHISLDVKSEEFWDFSWHEMGKYDIPAVIDYTLGLTGKPDLYYVGHSMGTTMFFTAVTENPDLNSKIRLMSAFSPVGYVINMLSPMRLMAPFANSIDWIAQFLGLGELMPDTWFMEFFGATVCAEESVFKELCANALFLMVGYNSDQHNATMLPIIMGHTPAGMSVRSLVHYGQGVNSGLFRQYNYGTVENLLKYGRPTPPRYDMSKITCPVAFYWGANDWMAAKKDVARLAGEIPNLVRNVEVPHEKFNHMDFLYAKDSDKLLYETFEEFMKNF